VSYHCCHSTLEAVSRRSLEGETERPRGVKNSGDRCTRPMHSTDALDETLIDETNLLKRGRVSTSRESTLSASALSLRDALSPDRRRHDLARHGRVVRDASRLDTRAPFDHAPRAVASSRLARDDRRNARGDRGGARGKIATKRRPDSRAPKRARPSGAFYLTLVPIRPRWRGERRSLRTLPGASLRPHHAFNPDTPRRLSTPTD